MARCCRKGGWSKITDRRINYSWSFKQLWWTLWPWWGLRCLLPNQKYFGCFSTTYVANSWEQQHLNRIREHLWNTQWCTLWSVLTLDVLHKIPVQQCQNSSNFCINCFISISINKVPMNVMTSSYNTRLSLTLSQNIIRMNLSFRIWNNSLNLLYPHHLKNKPEFRQPCALTKRLLIFSHGQSGVERGFQSITSGKYKYDYTDTIIAHRRVYHGINGFVFLNKGVYHQRSHNPANIPKLSILRFVKIRRKSLWPVNEVGSTNRCRSFLCKE